jgi:pSer/pThr/pTyr-binding forkhead associated (FHA) protein
VWETREIGVPAGETLFGRDDDAAIWIDDAGVSRRHARIVVDGGRATLEDLGSKNGTFVNGTRVARPVRLTDGDRIQVGRATLVFRELSQVRSTQTQRSGQALPATSRRK